MGQNIKAKFDEAQNEVRLSIMNFIIDEARPFSVEEDGFHALNGIKLSNSNDFEAIIHTLALRDGMVMDEDRNVNFIYPVSSFKTNHKVSLADGRSFSAMCAIDAIGSTFTFHQDTEINSKCSICGERIYVKMQGGKAVEHHPKTLHALTFKLEEIGNWAGSC